MKEEAQEQECSLYADVLANGSNFTWPEYATRNGLVSSDAANLRWMRYAKRNGLPIKLKDLPVSKVKAPPETETETDNIKTEERTENFIRTDIYSSYLYSEADVAAFFKIDTEIWEVEKTLTNYWEQGAKIITKSNTYIAKTPLYQLKLTWRRKKISFEVIKEALASQIRLSDFPPPAKIDATSKTLSVEIMVTDLHLGKVGFDPVTMEFNWTLPEAAAHFNQAVDHFLENLDASEIAEFVLPLGNDYLNVDNSSNQTRRGTPQMSGDFWHNVFRFGKQLAIAVIERLSLIAPVKVYMIKGNHDEDSVFSLGEVVDAYFTNNPNVEVTNHPVERNYHEFGLNMLGLAHGHEFKMSKAVQTMASDQPLMFGRTKFRSFHFGHLHQNKINKIIDLSYKEEHFGVDVEICPSLSPCDEWHYKNAYIGNLRRCKCFVRHAERGLVQELYYNAV